MKLTHLGISLAALTFLLSNSIALGKTTTNGIAKEIATPEPLEPEAVISPEKAINMTATNLEGPVQMIIQSEGLMEPLIANGEAVVVEDLGVRINPLEGWEVSPKSLGMSLIIEAPKATEIVYDEILFRPNLTVVAIHEPSPIDEIAAKELKEKLGKAIAKGAGVTVVEMDEEHQFFDYRGEKDGLVIYSSFSFGEAEMRQVHVIVSGEKRQFHLTYTDLASELVKDEVFDPAWAMMSSFQVTGSAPARFEGMKIFAAIFLTLLLLLGLFFAKRRRDFNQQLDNAEYDCESNSSWESNRSDISLSSHSSGQWSLQSDLPKTTPSRRLESSSF